MNIMLWVRFTLAAFHPLFFVVKRFFVKFSVLIGQSVCINFFTLG